MPWLKERRLGPPPGPHQQPHACHAINAMRKALSEGAVWRNEEEQSAGLANTLPSIPKHIGTARRLELLLPLMC